MNSLLPETRASLILRLQDPADSDAWNEFVGIYGPALVRVAKKRGLQSADIDNAIQEVLMSVANALDAWSGRSDRGSFRAWLLGIARNKAVDILSRRGTRTLAKGGDEGLRLFADQRDQHALSREIDLVCKRELFRLAACKVQASVQETTWQAFWLTSIDGMSPTDAASRLGIPVGNVYFARSRVMSKLRDAVMKYDEVSE